MFSFPVSYDQLVFVPENLVNDKFAGSIVIFTSGNVKR